MMSIDSSARSTSAVQKNKCDPRLYGLIGIPGIGAPPVTGM
jgi:hypothetical protein